MISHLLHMLLIEWQFGQPWPLLYAWSTAYLEDFAELIGVILSGEKRLSVDDFCENTAHRPYIDRGRIILGAEQNIWRSVP